MAFQKFDRINYDTEQRVLSVVQTEEDEKMLVWQLVGGIARQEAGKENLKLCVENLPRPTGQTHLVWWVAREKSMEEERREESNGGKSNSTRGPAVANLPE